MKTCPSCGATYDGPVRVCPKDGTILEGSTDAPDSRIGETLDGKYRLDAKLGQGGMGSIYRATHLMLDKQVAVKLIKPELVGSADLVRRFQREARAAGNLNHPNIAAAYDLGQTADGTLYIAMELIRGRSLKDVIRETGPLGVPRIITILRQIGSALALAHRHNIIHRDLKPHNVMLTNDGRHEVAKLLDFGIAKTFDEKATQLTATGFVLGTPQYMSPEQAAGRQIDGRSDLYSLGIILYEMLTGEVPFNDPSTPALLVKHLTETPAPPSMRRPDVQIPPALETIALRLLAKDPADRYQTADEFLAALPAETGSTAPVVAPTDDKTIVMPPPGQGGPATAQTPTSPRPGPAFTSEATAPAAPVAPPAVAATPAAASSEFGETPPAPPQAAAPPAPATPAFGQTPAGAAPAAAAAAAAGATPAAAAAPTPAPVSAPGAGAPPPSVSAPPPASVSAPPPASLSASAAQPAARSGRPLKDMLVLVGVMAFIVVGGAFAGMRLGLFGGGDDTVPTESAVLDAAAADGGSEGLDPAATTAGGETVAAEQASTDAVAASGDTTTAASSSQPPATSGSSSGAGQAAGSSAATPGASASQQTGQPAASQTVTEASTSAATPPTPPALPETPAVSFRCDGAAQVCGALRSAMTDAIGRHSLRPVSNEGTADVRVVADVTLADESSEQLFGSTFVIRTYSVEFTGETRDGEFVSMPAPTTLTFDAAYAQQKLPNDARTMATGAAGQVRSYWRQRLAAN